MTRHKSCVGHFPLSYLYVDISPIVDQEFQTEGPMCGGSSKVQRVEALVVGLTDISATVDQLTDNSILAIKTSQVERRVPKSIRLIYLS